MVTSGCSEQETCRIWIKNLVKPKEACKFKIGYKAKENDRSQSALHWYLPQELASIMTVEKCMQSKTT